MILCNLHVWVSGLLSSFYGGLYSHETWQVLVVLLGGYQITALGLSKSISSLNRTTFLQVNSELDISFSLAYRRDSCQPKGPPFSFLPVMSASSRQCSAPSDCPISIY